jgi:filamentous hemagglutinin family protein
VVKQYFNITSLIERTAFYAALLLSTTALTATAAFANPVGGAVSAGSASISSSGAATTVVETSNKAVIDWQSFNIASGETTRFIQPSSSSIVLNRINNGNPSQIFGHLDANGNIIILNPSGVLFGAESQVDVNGLIATTANISNQAFMANGALAFNQPGGSTSAIVNEGTITAADAGLVGLVAPNVINSGTITAKLGTVHLASADTFTVDFYGDGLLNFGVSDAVKSQLVANTGLISAAGGKIALTAAAGNNIVNSLIEVSGKLSAPAVGEKDGKIFIYAEGSNAVKGNVTANKGQKAGSSTVLVNGYLDASGYSAGQTGGTISVLADNIGIMSGALLDASGDAGGGTIKIGGDFHGKGATPTALNTYIDPNSLIMANANTTGNGGNIAVWSDNTTQFLGNILAEGGEQSGNGGYVETSGHGTLDAEGYVDLTAPKGSMGTWLLDPTNITIDGGVTPAFDNSAGVTDGTQVSLSSALQVWNDASDASTITLTYNSTGTSASGTAGMNTITVGSTSSLVVGERVQIGSGVTELASVNDTSNIYTITAISGNTLTLDASLGSPYSGATLYGGYVSQINDKSGNNNNAMQSSAGNMPLYIAAGQNGLGEIQFGTANNAITYLDGPVSITSNNLTTFLSGNYINFGNNSSDNYGRFLSLYENGGTDYSNTNSVIPLAVFEPSNGLVSYRNNVAVLSYALPGANVSFIDTFQLSGGNMTGGINGNNTTTGTTSNASLNVTNYRIGQDTAVVDSGLYGDVQENIIYNSVLSTNAQALINQYQSAKWGIALTGPGVIGSEAGLTGAEAQAAMASIQGGAATDGYSVFAASYLTRLSQTSNIILDASNNINLDLQGTTLSLAAGKNITLTAGNQIVTDSAGEISTSQSGGTGGNITFNATHGIIFNNAFTLSSGGGNIDLNNDVTLGAALTANAGAGTLTFGGKVDGNYSLTVTGAPVNFEGNVGSSTAIGVLDVAGTANLYGNVTTNNAAITFNNAVNLDGDATINSGTATTTFDGTIDGDYNLTASAGTFSLSGVFGSSTPLADVSLTSTTALTLPSVSAASIFARTTSASADLTIGSGSILTASGSGAAVTLAGGQNFVNDEGSDAINLTGSGRWLIYSATPGNDTFDSLNSGNTAVWDAAYGGAITQTGDRYVFSYQPTLTFTSTSDSKTYGVDATSGVASDYSVSGFEAAVSNVYLADTDTTAFSGTPNVTSSGSAITATVSGGPYIMTTAVGTLASVDGYAFSYASSGSLTVNTAPLTVSASNETKNYGTVYSPGTTAFTTSGLLNSDSVTSATLTSVGAGATATVAGGSYSIVPSAASGSGLSNYTITYDNGSLTVNAVALTITADNETKIYGTVNNLGTTAFTTSGLLNSDSVAGVSLSSSGTISTASVAGGPYTIVPSAASGAGLSNYTITYNNGVLTVNAASLSITAASQTITSNMVVPTTTLIYSGFANGQDNTALATQPTVASTESGTVPEGTYTGNYIASGAIDTNYNISYVAGDLIVNPSPITSLPSTVIVASQNVPPYTSSGITSNNPIAVANNTVVIDAPEQEAPLSKPQSAVTSYIGNDAAGVNTLPVLSMFGGILTIDPALVSKFKLEYLKNKL